MQVFLKVGEHSSSDDGDTKINIQDRIEQNAARVLARQRIANESSATQDVCVLASSVPCMMVGPINMFG